MMVGKLFSLLTLLAGFGVLHNDLLPPYSTDFVVENHVLKEVNDKTANEIRIYSSSGVTSIDEHAFDGCSFTSIMVSNSVTTFAPTLTDGITLNLTNDKASYSFALPENVVINEYACDEGFINYWNDKVRPDGEVDVCSMSIDDYILLKDKYDLLVAEDKAYVNDYIDKAEQSIEDTMDYLSKYFEEEKQTNPSKKNLPQDMTIGIIVSVAIFGMTTISIFYILKQQKIIN